MKWIWVAVGLFLLAVCQADGFDEIVDLDKLDIKKIQKVEDGLPWTTCEVTFKTGEITLLDNINKYELDISTNDEHGNATQEPYSVDKQCSENPCTIQFPDLITTGFLKNVDFLLRGMTSSGVEKIVGTTSWTPFPELSDEYVGELVNNGSHYILRLIGDTKDMNEFTPLPGGTQVTSDSTPTITYFLDSNSLTNIAACCKNDDDCLFCGNNVPLDPTAVIPKTLTVESALLSYDGKDGTPIVAILVKSTTTADHIDVLKTYKTIRKLFQSTSLEADVPIEDFTHGMEIPMTIIGLANGDNTMVEYGDFSIQDMDVTLNLVSDTSFEVRWNYQEGVNEYKITRTIAETGVDTGFSEATVACDGASFQHCYGYFTHLAESDYTATVPVTKIGDKKVQSKSIEVGSSTPDLNIQHVQLQGYGNALKATVCFNHTNNNADEAFSHYDVVLIDHNGQFQKDKLITMKAAEDDHFCSRPFSVKHQDFEVTEEAKVIVIKRAQDGLSVLASGEASLL